MEAGEVAVGKFKLPSHFNPLPVGALRLKGQSTMLWGDDLVKQTATIFKFRVLDSHSIHALFPKAAESWSKKVSRSTVEPALMLLSVITSCNRNKLKISSIMTPVIVREELSFDPNGEFLRWGCTNCTSQQRRGNTDWAGIQNRLQFLSRYHSRKVHLKIQQNLLN
jgi:hypothetical protein